MAQEATAELQESSAFPDAEAACGVMSTGRTGIHATDMTVPRVLAGRQLGQPSCPSSSAASLSHPSQSGQISRCQHLSPITSPDWTSSGVTRPVRMSDSLGRRAESLGSWPDSGIPSNRGRGARRSVGKTFPSSRGVSLPRPLRQVTQGLQPHGRTL